MGVVVFLHIAAAIFTIGPLTAVTMSAPRAIRAGRDGLPALRLLTRLTRVYGAASILVFVLGLVLVAVDEDTGFNEFWLSASMTLFLVALGLLFGLVERDERRAVERMEAGEAATVKAGRIAGVSGAVTLIWLVILALMVYGAGGE